MKLNEIKGYDLNKLNQLYEEFLKRNNPTKEETDVFLTEYIDRCECCGELCFSEELEERKMWSGNTCLCCEACRTQVDDDWEISQTCEPDPYDEYIDRKMEEDYNE